MKVINQYVKFLSSFLSVTLIPVLGAVTCMVIGASSLVIAAEDKEILYWVAPMDPNYRRDKPGKSPMGMDLIPVYADGGKDAGTISVSPNVIQSLGVRTKTAERTTLWRSIDTVGYVDYDESKISHIHLRTEGWIENLAVKSEGGRVKKGEFLFDVYSPKLVNAQDELVNALNSGNKALITASKERLSALGVSDMQISQLQKDKKVKQRISIYSPQDGVVSDLPVREGMFVSPSMKVMTLGDISSIWILAEVFERQEAWVELGQTAEVKLSYLPGKTWEGKVEYIYPDLDPKTRTLKVRLRFDNPGENLKPNMYANVKIYGGPKNNIVVIPLEGLIRTGRNQRVIIDQGDGKFAAREVLAGMESGDYVEIIKGVEAGDRIVVSGQFLIDSESSMRASLDRMSAPGNNENSAMTDKQSADDTKIVSASGIIKQINVAEHELNIQHQPIDDLGWPAMTMNFSLAAGLDISGLSINDKVMFQLEQRDDHYLITSVHKMDPADSSSGVL